MLTDIDAVVLPKHMQELNPDIYLSDNYIVLDKETTNYDYGHARNNANSHLLTVWRDSRRFYYSLTNEYELAELHRAIADADFIVAHNAKFEAQWLQREGFDISNLLIYDTLLAEYVLQGNIRKPLDLDSVARRYNVGTKSSYIAHAIGGGVNPAELPTSLLVDYCKNDVDVTHKIFLQQRKILKEKGLLPTLFTRCIFTPVLADTEFKGMHLDKERVTAEYAATVKERAELEVALVAATGGINLNSTKQVGEFLYKTLGFSEPKDHKGNILKTAGGAPMTDSATILGLDAKTEEQQKFKDLYLRYNKVDSALSKNLEYFYGVVTEGDGTFFANFNQSITQTHRLSSSGQKSEFKMFANAKGKIKAKSVQFQNFPRAYKKLFAARKEGWNIIEADAAQLEYRVAAFLGQDSQAKSDIENGEDVHSFTAAVIFASKALKMPVNEAFKWMVANKDTDKRAKEWRQKAKAFSFKPLYGGGDNVESGGYCAEFKKKYWELENTQHGWTEEVLNKKQLTTCTGLIFYWPDTTMSRAGYISNTTSIYNYPVQSLATAEIIPIAVTYLWHYMKALKLKAFLVNTIHDSVVLEAPKEETNVIDELSKKAFTQDVVTYLQKVYNVYFDVPLDTEMKVSKFWGEKE